jgi:hypothetical protein
MFRPKTKYSKVDQSGKQDEEDVEITAATEDTSPILNGQNGHHSEENILNGDGFIEDEIMVKPLVYRRQCCLFIVSILVGIVFAALVLRNDKASTTQTVAKHDLESPKTTSPTITTTIAPTMQPTITQVPDEYIIDQNTVDMWHQFEKERDTLKQNKTVPRQEMYLEYICKPAMTKYPNLNSQKYPFPPKMDHYQAKSATLNSPTWNIYELKNHLIQYRNAIANYYHYATLQEMQPFDPLPGTPSSEASLNRIATGFYRKLQESMQRKTPFSITYGFHGTSVMSGHDNCYRNTLAPLMKRSLEHIFAPLLPKIEVRNAGQNGDSPEQTMQLFCSEAFMGENEIDFLHLWYPMMPQASDAVKEAFVRRWFIDSKTLLQITSTIEFRMDKYVQAGFMSSWSWQPGDAKVDWLAGLGENWGTYGDAFCRLETRDGIRSVVMQNWHRGPLGFQFGADSLSMLLLYSMDRAVQWMINSVSILPTLPSLPNTLSELAFRECTSTCGHRQCANTGINKTEWNYACTMNKPPPIACVSSNQPQWKQEADFKTMWNARSIKDGKNSMAWVWTQVKFPSSVHAAAEQALYNYRNDPDCTNFKDIGWLYASTTNSVTDWLELTWNDRASQRLKESKTMNIYVSNGSRYPYPIYTARPGKDWLLFATMNGVPLGPGVSIETLILGICLRANSLGPIPVPPEGSNVKFAFQFRNNKSDNTQPVQEIRIGNIIFMGSPT